MAKSCDEDSPILAKQKEKEASSISSMNKITFFFKNITTEPAMFFYFISFTIDYVFLTNMFVDKTCQVMLNYSQEVCQNLDSGDYVEEQNAVQKITTDYQMYGSWIEYGIGIIVMNFLGALSDKRGRRLALVIPLVGFALKNAVELLNAYFWTWEPYFLILSYVPIGLGGSGMAVYMASYAYIGNHSRKQSRTSRLSFASVMLYVASPVGNALGTIIYMKGGYIYTFLAALTASILSILYALIRLESGPPRVRDGETPPSEKKTILGVLRDSLMIVVKPRPGRQRALLISNIFCIWITLASYEANSFLFLYTRKVFQWDYFTFNIYSIANTPVALFASCVTIPLLSYRLRLEDSLLGFIGSISHIFYGIIVGTAPVAWALYVALIVSSGSSMIFTSSRGALSKLVASYELGGIFSIVALGEALIPIITKPIFTLIYNSTLDVFPGAVFLVGAFTGIIVCCVYTWILTSNDKPDEKEPEV